MLILFVHNFCYKPYEPREPRINPSNCRFYDGDGVTLKTPRPRGWVASARACGQKACLDLNLG